MGFLQPALLFLGLAAAVPLILHLFQRHHGPRVVFPALRYLRRAEKESARQIRLRQLLLMLMRIAAVLLLALAAARPFVRAAGAEHEPTAVAIVFDNSLSSGLVVGDRRVLDELRDRALEVLERATPDDRFWLIAAGTPGTPAFAGDALELMQYVRDIEPTAAGADLVSALTHARALLAAGAEGRASEIHLLSDLQASAFGSMPPAGEGGPPVLAWIPARELPPNAWVEAVTVGGGLAPIAGERAAVTAAVRGEAATDSVAIRLTIDGRAVAAAITPVGAAAVLSSPARDPGLLSGWVETDPDALRADDRRYFAVPVQPPPDVATSAPLPFVDDALAVLEAAGRIRRSPLEGADIALLPTALGIESVRSDGAIIVMPPGSALELPAVNRRLGAAGIPWRYDVAGAGGEARFDIASDADDMLRTLENARLLRVFAFRARDEAARGDTVLLRLRDGAPWAIRGNRPGGGRYLLLASSLSDSSTSLPTSAAMLPLLDRLIGTWTPGRHSARDLEPGGEIDLPAGAVTVLGPDGVRESVGGSATWRVGGEAGLYEVRGTDSLLTVLAVNGPVSESQLERVSRRGLEGALPGWKVHFATNRDDWLRTAYVGRLGREAWQPLLALALAVLLLEAVVASTGRRKKERESPDTAAAEAGEPAA